MTKTFNQNDVTKTELTKDNLLPSVLKWCIEYDTDIKSINVKPWDPSGEFHEKYSNRQIEIEFNGDPTGYSVSIVNNRLAYGKGFEVALKTGTSFGSSH